VTANPDHDVNTNEHVVDPANHDTVYPREQQGLAFKLLTDTHAHSRYTGRHPHTHTHTETLRWMLPGQSHT